MSKLSQTITEMPEFSTTSSEILQKSKKINMIDVEKTIPKTIVMNKNKNLLDFLMNFSTRSLEIEIFSKVTSKFPSGIAITLVSGTIRKYMAKLKINASNVEGSQFDAGYLISRLEDIRSFAATGERDYYINELLDFILMLDIFTNPKSLERVRGGKAQFYDCYLLFGKNTEVVIDDPNGAIGGNVVNYRVQQTTSGLRGVCTINVISATKNGPENIQYVRALPYFDNEINISDLPIRPISEKEKSKLTSRGHKFAAYTKDATMVSYTGSIGIPTWMGEHTIRADGRAIVDGLSLAEMNPSMYRQMMNNMSPMNRHSDDDDKVEGIILQEQDLWRTFNRVPAFSMRIKSWGWMAVENMQDIQWRDNAFDQLVLRQDYKDTIYSLVQHYRNAFTDFIDGKSGGLVFLLHGPTGQGKTLTAEAVAEALHRPLYSVSMGELGTTPDEMEERLRQILDLSHKWNAVLLLDEADIFMEARDTNNVERNAMVSIFLRLLEYHAGVMFLTTNRVRSFDPAFFSRISLAIRYAPLQADSRKTIWINILTAANIDMTNLDIDQLASYDVNGRNIKSVVRLAQTMAFGENVNVTQDHLLKVLVTTARFNQEIAGVHNPDYDTGDSVK